MYPTSAGSSRVLPTPAAVLFAQATHGRMQRRVTANMHAGHPPARDGVVVDVDHSTCRWLMPLVASHAAPEPKCSFPNTFRRPWTWDLARSARVDPDKKLKRYCSRLSESKL